MNEVGCAKEKMQMTDQHCYYMQKAYDLANEAKNQGEVPIGAILVLDNKIIGQGFNQSITNSDPTAHAEIIALRQAGVTIQNYRLMHAVMYVTLEPCVMCASAMIHARIKELIFAAYDSKNGAICSAFELFNHASFNHKISWQGGVLETRCSELLKSFFKMKRKNN